jgi:hypothetical protein
MRQGTALMNPEEYNFESLVISNLANYLRMNVQVKSSSKKRSFLIFYKFFKNIIFLYSSL